GAPPDTAGYGCPRGRPFLSRTIAPAQGAGHAPPPVHALIPKRRAAAGGMAQTSSSGRPGRFVFPVPRVPVSTMKSLLSSLRSLACAALMAPAILWAQAPQPPEIAARNYLLVDVTAGQVLAAKDIDAPVEQASLTKLMTGYLVFDALRAKKITLEQRLPVSERAWKMPGSRMFIDPKMQVPVDDLLKGMIVQSGNDATVALAEGVGGTVENFVRLMNEQAKALGMTNTAYKNPEGLTEPGHTTTARDLATLSTRLMQDFPEYM